MSNQRKLAVTCLCALIILIGCVFFLHTKPNKNVSLHLTALQSENTLQSQPIAVPILIYHSVKPHMPNESPIRRHYTVSPQSFEQQLQYLQQNHYNVITFAALVNMITNHITPPPHSVVITFDDGWENQYVYAYPLLKQYHDVATFFIFTNGVNSKGFLTWNQVDEMNTAGMDFESHSVSHPYLFRMTDPAAVEHEIADSKNIIDTRLNKTLTTFAYPFGYPSDLAIQDLKNAGYQAARTDIPAGKYANTDGNLFTLNGAEVSDDFKDFLWILGQFNTTR